MAYVGGRGMEGLGFVTEESAFAPDLDSFLNEEGEVVEGRKQVAQEQDWDRLLGFGAEKGLLPAEQPVQGDGFLQDVVNAESATAAVENQLFYGDDFFGVPDQSLGLGSLSEPLGGASFDTPNLGFPAGNQEVQVAQSHVGDDAHSLDLAALSGQPVQRPGFQRSITTDVLMGTGSNVLQMTESGSTVSRHPLDTGLKLEHPGKGGKRKAFEQRRHGGSFDGAAKARVFPSESRSLDNLAEHVRGISVQEPSVKNCKCNVCGKAFAKKYTLIQHQRIHNNERSHKCPIEGCGRDFVQRANLSQHMRYHTGEKPYICDEPHCNAAYYQLANLKSHLKAKHGRDAPRKCRIRGCGKGFVTVEELNEHLRVEHGRAPIAPPKGLAPSNSSGYC